MKVTEAGEKKSELTTAEKAWAGVSSDSVQGTMELQCCWIIKDATQFPQKVDAKILNWKTTQEAAEKKPLQNASHF